MKDETLMPKTLMEAIVEFAKPGVALRYLARMRWPNGVFCPRQGCGEMNPIFLETRGIWKCRGCRKQFSVKVGTVMEDSPLSVEKGLEGHRGAGHRQKRQQR